MQIVIASRNTGKIKEIKSFTRNLTQVEWLTFMDFKNFPHVEENGSSFLENARLKARAVSGYTGKVTLADDSGLEVDFLRGKPGIKSSRYAGDRATDKENRDKLLDELKGVKKVSGRKARFVCRMVLWDREEGAIFEGKGVCSGHIGFEEKGTGGFGYDSIFIPSGYKKTMAQLDREEKNSISHRGKAIKAVCGFIVNF